MKKIKYYRPNKNALPPLLNVDKEKERIDSINQRISEDLKLQQSQKRLNKIIYKK